MPIPSQLVQQLRPHGGFPFVVVAFSKLGKVQVLTPPAACSCPAAEIIKRRVPDIHQTTEINSITIVDVWEPKEEGLDTLETQVGHTLHCL